jgi:hypothetical protein
MKVATFHLERGVALGKLDQLIGSRTLEVQSPLIATLGSTILWV